MTEYRDTVVDLTRPHCGRDWCAIAIIDALQAQAAPMLSRDLRAAIIAAGADPTFQAEAVKGLKNIGYPICRDRRRHLTTWWLNPTTAESEAERESRVRDGYSQSVTTARVFAAQLLRAPGDPIAVQSHRRAVQMAIDHGTDSAMGMSIQQVVDACEPLPVP